MVSFLDAINAYKSVDGAALGEPNSPSGGDVVGEGFAQTLRTAAQDTVDALNSAERQSLSAAAGQADLSQVVTAVAQAEIKLQSVVAVRDKVIGAYQDILKMPI